MPKRKKGDVERFSSRLSFKDWSLLFRRAAQFSFSLPRHFVELGVLRLNGETFEFLQLLSFELRRSRFNETAMKKKIVQPDRAILKLYSREKKISFTDFSMTEVSLLFYLIIYIERYIETYLKKKGKKKRSKGLVK